MGTAWKLVTDKLSSYYALIESSFRRLSIEVSNTGTTGLSSHTSTSARRNSRFVGSNRLPRLNDFWLSIVKFRISSRSVANT